MTRTRLHHALFIAAIASVAIVGCKKKEEAPPVAAPAPAPVETAPAPAPAPTVSVTAVDLGSAVGPDLKVTTATTTFKPKDTIYASIATSTSDPAATVPGKLGVQWTYNDASGPMLINKDEAPRDVAFTGAGANEFHIAKPDGFPVGKYKVDVTLDGNVVQSKEFEVVM